LEQMRTGGRQALPMGPSGGLVPGTQQPPPGEGRTGQYL
jgi:hypothetical protein